MTLPTGLNPEQIVEILVLTEEGNALCSYGSGYQLAAGLVATARHVVRGKLDRALADGLAIQVRFSARQSASTSAVAIGRVRWEGSAVDLALLELEWPGPTPDWPLWAPVLGDVPLAARKLTYEALGYPHAKVVTLANAAELRDSEAASGRVSAQDNLKTGALQLRTGMASRVDQWGGFSGAPVFVNKFFVGVVTHDDAGDLRACRLSVAVGEGPRVDVDSVEPGASARALRDLLAGHHIDPRTVPARRQPIYRQTIEDLRPAGGLLDRDDEIADLTAFATADSNGELTRPYLDWTGAPGAGATRLAAEFAAVPPPGVDLIAFFATRGVPGQTAEFWTHACDQLAAVLDDPPLAPGPADGPLFASLWQQASEQARATRRPLMLLIEGLDCDGPLRPMIADSIPDHGDATSRIAVFRRDQPDLRLPATHPLRSQSTCTRRVLRPLEIARRRRAADRAQLDRLLADHPQAGTILDLVAIAGPLTGAELAGLLAGEPTTGADPLAAVRQLKKVSDGLSQAVDAGVLRPEAAEAERVDFAEDAVRRMTTERWVPGTADAYRRVIYAWAERYAARGWPDDTPPYLMTGYASMLSGAATQFADAAAALAGLATPERTAAVRRAAGAAAALRELTLVLDRMASSSPPDLPTICRLALRREQLVRSQAFAPVALIDAHARLGQWSRARQLAEQLQMPMDRVSAFLQVASAAADAGRDRFADLAFEEALRSCAALDPAAWPERTTALQSISQTSAASSRLIDPDAVVEVFPDPSTAVPSLIGFVVSYARAGHPVWASRFVVRAAALSDSLLPTPEVPVPAETPTPADDAATGHQLTDVATRQKAMQDHYNAVQTVFTGALVLARMTGTAAEHDNGEDPLTAIRRHVSAAAKAIEAVPDPALRPTLTGELGFAAARAGHSEVVAELMATAMASAGGVVDPAARAWMLCSLSPALGPTVHGAVELVRATAEQLVGIIDPAARATARASLVPAAAACESDAAALFAAALADAGQLAAPGTAVGGPAVLETLAVAAAACRWLGPVTELAAGCADPGAWSRAHTTLAAAAVNAADTALAVQAVEALRDPIERINAYFWLTDMPAALGELGASLCDAARHEAAALPDAGQRVWVLRTIAQKATGIGLIAPARAAIDDLESPIECANLLAAAAATPAARSMASALIAEALGWAGRISDAAGQTYAFGAIADAAVAAGDVDGSRHAVAHLGDPYQHALGLAQVAWAAALAGPAPSAADDLAAAISAARALPDSGQRAFVFAALAQAALVSHQPELAEQLVAAADGDVGQADRVLQSGTLAALSAASVIGPARSVHLFEQACRTALVDDLPRRLAALDALAEYAAGQPEWPELFAPFAARAQAATTPLDRSHALGGLAAATARAGEPAAALTLASRLEDPVVKIQTLVGLARPAVLAGDPGSAETALRGARATADSLIATAPSGADPVSWASGEIVGAALSSRLVPLAEEMAMGIRDAGLAAAAAAATAAIANLDATGFWWAPSPYATGYYTLAVVRAACSAGRAANVLALPSTVPDASFGAFLAAEIAEAAIAVGDTETAKAAVVQAPATVNRFVRGRLGAVAVGLLQGNPDATAAELARRLAGCLTPELARRAAEREPLVLDAVAAELGVALPPAE